MIERARRLPMAVRALRLARRRESHDRWSSERVRADQRERLLAIVRHAAANSPYYRERLAGIELSDDLDPRALPTLDKATMLEHFDELVTDRRLTLASVERHLAELEDVDSGTDPMLLGEYRVVASGGTSGRRGVFVYGRADWVETLAGVGVCWGGYFDFAPRLLPHRRRIAAITANLPLHMSGRWNRSLDVGVHRFLRLEARAPAGELVEALNAFRPEGINTYPSSAALLAERQLAGELRIEPQVVGTAGEVLTAEMREQIVAAWGPVLFDYYGASEVGLIAAECERRAGMHLFEDQVLFEVVDDDYRPVPDGEPGSRLLVTNLFNRTQPLIRYELNDLVTVSPDPCSCGRPYPMLKSVQGRSDDVLEMPATAGGTVKVHPLTLRSPLAGVAALSEYRIVYGAGELRVEAVLNGRGDRGQACREIGERLEAALREAGAEAPPIQVGSVEEIPRHPHSGKHKAVEVEAA
jgi:phenylacetate-CoA ligase